MVSSNVFSDGQVQAVLRGAYTAKGQWAHHVSAAALFILLSRAYAEDSHGIPFEQWCMRQSL